MNQPKVPPTYRFDPDWARRSGAAVLGTTHAVNEDSQGRIYIHNTGPHSMVVFSPDGEVLSAWDNTFSAGAHGARLVAEGNDEFFYLAATHLHQAYKTDLAGNILVRYELPPRKDIYAGAEAFVPTETAVASDGRVFVADGYGASWIHIYENAGSYISSFGGPGSEAGRVQQPHGIAIDRRDGTERLVVADRMNNRLQYFDLEGNSTGFVTEGLRMPCTAKTWGDYLFVPDLYSNMVVFDKDNRKVGEFGYWDRCWERADWPNLPDAEWRSDAFIAPHDLHVDAAGRVYMAEWISDGRGKVTRLEPES